MSESSPWALEPSIIAFTAAALVIGICGVMLTSHADRLARVTRLGQALMGAVFLGATTSLSGLITSLAAAYDNHPQLAVSNAVGGIAVQTTFLAVADTVYRRVNLEHAAASEANLVQATLLVVLLTIAIIGQFIPNITLYHVAPTSLLLIGAYGFGLHLVSESHQAPMWLPRRTRETQPPEPRTPPGQPGQLLWLWGSFLSLAAIVALGGWVIARAAVAIAIHSGMSEGTVGTLFTATATSLPEAVIAVAAVRRGALTLAVGDIIGGNTFDVLFLAFSDAVYRPGSIYYAVTATQSFWLALSLLMTSVLLLGLLRREKHGIGNIGFESLLVLILYAAGLLTLLF